MTADCANIPLISGENHYLADHRIVASSQLDGNHGPDRSRLYQTAEGDQAGGWVPEFMDDQQWIQVRGDRCSHLTGISLEIVIFDEIIKWRIYVNYWIVYVE